MGDMVHETLERLDGVFEAEWHPGEFEESEGRCDCCLRDVLCAYGDLVEAFHQVDLREDAASGEVCGEMMDVRDRVGIA